MTWLSAIIMGLVQGIAEFLPISSSGHLAIAEHLLNVQGASEIPQFYDVLLHLGTLVAVFIAYWDEIYDMIVEFFAGVGDLVHIIIHALIHALDAAADIDLPLQELRIIDTGKALDFFDECQGLFVCNEFRRLHTVDQQLELRHFKCARADVIPGRFRLGLHDVHPERAQCLEIAVNALALSRYSALRQLCDHLRHGHRMTFVRLLQQDLHQVQQLQFLIR